MNTRLSPVVALCVATSLWFAEPAGAHLAEGLLASYPFNGNAKDETGNGNDGETEGTVLTDDGEASAATLAQDRFGNPDRACHFDGSSSCIFLQNCTLDIAHDDYTIAAWVRTSPPTNNGGFFSKGSSLLSTGHMMRMDGDRVLLENSHMGQALVGLRSASPIADGRWHFVAGVVNRATGATLYIDGKRDSSREIETAPCDFSTGEPALIGANDRHPSLKEYFRGEIDEARLFNRALSEQEIAQLFSHSKPFGSVSPP